MLSDLVFRLGSLFRRKAAEMELDDELRFHFEQLVEKHVSSGLTRQEAQRRAKLAFGGLDQVKEECREARGVNLVESLVQDVRFGARTLCKTPGFAAVAVLTIGLGIGLNATIFSVVSGVLLRRPPVFDPDRLVSLVSTNAAKDWSGSISPVSVPNFVAWRQQSSAFEGLAAAEPFNNWSLSGGEQPERVSVTRVTANYFSILGVSPALGRAFLAEEDRPGHDHVAILSHSLWKRRFGADPSLVGRAILLNGESYVVAGVLPATFRLWTLPAQIWTPLVFREEHLLPAGRQSHDLYVIARLKPDASIRQARAEMESLARRAAQDFPEAEKGWSATVFTLQEYMIRDFNVRPALVILTAAVGFILLIACANIAGLSLARGTTRAREIAVRATLGARRSRLLRMLLTESLLIAAGGAVLGLLLSFGGVSLLRSALQANEALRSLEFGIDGNVMAFLVAVSATAVVLFGLAPAFETAKPDLNAVLRSDTRAGTAGPARTRLRSVLVAGEIALALFLLIGTGLLLKSITEGLRQSMGFDPKNLLTADVELEGAAYQEPLKQTAFFREVLGRLKDLPGVESAAAATSLPAAGAPRVAFEIQGQADVPANERPRARYYDVSPEYFRTAGISMLRGRAFLDSDREAAPRVVVVNGAFVQHFFDGVEPLGKAIRIDNGNASADQWREIIGVVSNVKSWPIQLELEPQVYETYLQSPVSEMSLLVRTRANPATVASDFRGAVWAVDKSQPLGTVIPLADLLYEETAGDRILGTMLGFFAWLALALAAIGIYGIVSYGVAQRTHEIGVRMALGAQRSEVRWLILRDGLKLLLIGCVVGLITALPLPVVLAKALYEFRVRTFSIYLIAPAVIAAVALLACYIPARRAMRVAPMVALRYE